MTKLKFFWGGGGWRNQIWTWEKKMTKLKFLGVGVGRIRFGFGKKNDKVEIFRGGRGGGGVGGEKDFGCMLVNFLL